MAINGTRYYEYYNNVSVGIYAKKSGVWSKVTDVSVYIDGGNYYTTGGSRSFSWAVNDTYQLGTGVQAFGVAVNGADYGTPTLLAFTHAKWQAQGSSGGTRSATPNGEQSTITVRPL